MKMTIEKAISYLENMKWLKGYCNTTVDGVPLVNVIDEIVTLLKPQPARLVTEADFENADEYGFIPAWYEGLVNKESWWNCIPKESLETAKEDGCRYWTAKPSLKQMEETPW